MALASNIKDTTRNDSAVGETSGETGIEPFPVWKPEAPRQFEHIESRAARTLVDIRNLPLEERRALLDGKLLHVFEGDELICDIPVRLFLTTSTRAHEMIVKGHGRDCGSRRTWEMRLPPGVGQEPVLHLVAWLKAVTTKDYVPNIQRREYMAENLRICRAARLLGMENCIESVALSNDDPLFNCIAKRLSHMVFRGKIPDPQVFDDFLDEHERYRIVVRDTVRVLEENRHHRAAEKERQEKKQQVEIAEREARPKAESDERRARRRSDWQERISRTNAQWERRTREDQKARKVAREEHRKKEAEIKESLHAKMNCSQVRVVTAEEARFLRRRQ